MSETRKAWSAENVETLVRLWMVRPEVPIEEIAEAVGHPASSVNHRLSVLRGRGVDLPYRASKAIAVARLAAPKPAVRACNLCDRPWQPKSSWERFCPACKHNGLTADRIDGNWATF